MWWLVAIGAGLGILLYGGARANATATALGLTAEDVEYLARMVTMEHPNGTEIERAGIVWVAINRLRSGRFGGSIRDVVTATNFAGSGADGDRYRRLIQSPAGYTEGSRHSPLDHARWDDDYAVCLAVADGEIDNPIGPRLHFLHPSGMPGCSVEGEERGSSICQGGKLLPRWAVAGFAANDPMWIGITLFS